MTRLEFHGDGIEPPVLASPASHVLRIDFTAADASALPSKLEVGTKQVASVLRVPALTGVLPPNVSARFLVMLTADGLSWSAEPSMDKVSIFIGDAEKAANTGLVLRDSAYGEQASAAVAAMSSPDAKAEELPAEGEALPRSVAFAVSAEQSIRTTPSAVASEMGVARAGEMKLADARRGDWVHLVGGGWLRVPAATESASAPATSSGATPNGSAPPPPPPANERTPAAWSVVTLGTGLQADIEEILPSDPDNAALGRLFTQKARFARLAISVQGGNFGFNLPPKKGRVTLTLSDGRVVESLDPREMTYSDADAKTRGDQIFDAPSLGAGDTWETVLVFPPDLDFLRVDRVVLEIGDMQHSLFRVPGSGERPDQRP